MVRDRSSLGNPAGESSASDGTNVLFDVWLVSRLTSSLIDAAIAPSGLTADEFAVYSVLVGGPRTPGDLARWVAAPLTTVSSYIKRFEARGHVMREKDPEDGRSYRVTLTAAGRRAHRDAGRRFLTVLDGVTAGLGTSEPSVRTALATLRTALVDVHGG